MGIFDTFSKRRKKAIGVAVDVYSYDVIPKPLRNQIIHILLDAFGRRARDDFGEMYFSKYWTLAHDIMCRELGVFNLSEAGNNFDQCIEFLQTSQTEPALDFIEILFKMLNGPYRKAYNEYRNEIAPDSAIEELNARFREHSVGYSFSGDEIIRVDNQFLHQEVVKNVLSLLNDHDFSGANDEFLKAHDHFRHGKIKEALNEALKAFESTMKTICDRKKWSYEKSATANSLIGIIFKNNLISEEMQQHFTSLRSMLASGVPTVRNTKGGHGQGSVPIEVPSYYAGYALHMTASNIVFLVSAFKDHKS